MNYYHAIIISKTDMIINAIDALTENEFCCIKLDVILWIPIYIKALYELDRIDQMKIGIDADGTLNGITFVFMIIYIIFRY